MCALDDAFARSCRQASLEEVMDATKSFINVASAARDRITGNEVVEGVENQLGKCSTISIVLITQPPPQPPHLCLLLLYRSSPRLTAPACHRPVHSTRFGQVWSQPDRPAGAAILLWRGDSWPCSHKYGQSFR